MEEKNTSGLDAATIRFNSDAFIDNVCKSYYHEFGLLTEKEKQLQRFDCMEWMRAIINNWEYFKNDE